MYKIVRQHRKSIALTITDELEVVVKAPYGISDQEIKKVVAKNIGWIEKTKEQKQLRMSYVNWIERGEIYYLGKLMKIKVIETKNNKSCIKCIEDAFVIEVTEVEDQLAIKALMEKYWREEAFKLFTSLTKKYCKELGCDYQKITIRKQKTRWGSCSNKGNISYNLKLLGAPIEVIEYIVLHEVMHLIHFNHGAVFWQTIEQIMPNYKMYQAYLKKQGMYLGI